MAASLGDTSATSPTRPPPSGTDGTLLPYPKPLSVLVDGKGPKRQVSPAGLGLQAAPATPWLAGIALLDRTGSGAPSVEAVPTVQALPALAEQTSALQLLDRPLHLVAGHLQSTGGLRRVTYREADDLEPVVADLIQGADEARRLPVLDEYLEGDQVVVFVDGRVIALSALATAALFGRRGSGRRPSGRRRAGGRVRRARGGSDPMAMTLTTLESLADLRLVEWE